jgi:hypothetical protein
MGGAAAFARAEPPAIEVLSPRPGQTLRAGGDLLLEWRAPNGLPEDIEEWEVFLSLDGGTYWAHRLTPHLAGDVTRFQARLPAIASDGARLLFRFGDEHEEVELELPSEWVVAPALLPPAVELSHFVAGSGESARPGEPGVATWIDGPRDGSRRVRYARDETCWQPRRPALEAGFHLFAELEEASRQDPGTPHDGPVSRERLPLPKATLIPDDTPQAVPVPRRLSLLSRRNE